MKWGRTNERKSVLKKNSSKSFSESVKLNSEGANLEAREMTCMCPEVFVGLGACLKFCQDENKTVGVYKTSQKGIN